MDTNDSDTPALPRPGDLPPVRTQRELHRQWISLVGEPGFARDGLWLMLLGPDGRPLGQVTMIDEVPQTPDAGVDALMQMFAVLLADLPGASLAVLRTRPGPAPLTGHDVTWARALLAAAAEHDVATWPVHVAGDEGVVVVPPDALAARSA